jgi:hypothetical protein
MMLLLKKEARAAEEEAVGASINLSGNHQDINAEAARPSPSSSAKKKKPTSKKPPPSPDATTRQVIEYYKQNATKESPMPSDAELLIQISSELETHASSEFHTM